MSKTILVLNGGVPELQIILTAKRLGYYVISTGTKSDAIGHKYADQYIYADYSDKDAISQIVINNKIDALCSAANDFSYLTSCYICEELGLPGHDSFETALLLNHKDRFKLFAQKHNIPTPEARCYNDLNQAVNEVNELVFPLMVKSADFFSGNGVSKVNSLFEAKEAIKSSFQLSRSHNIVIESFIQGKQYTICTFLSKHKVVAYCSNNSYSTINPYLINLETFPSDCPEPILNILIYQIEKISGILNLTDGIFTAQFIVHNSKPYIIETMRRCLGNQYFNPATLSSGFNWSEWLVKSEAGEDCSRTTWNSSQTNYTAFYAIMAKHNGVLKDIRISDVLTKHMYHNIKLWSKGYCITNFMNEKLQFLYLQFKDYDEMESMVKNIDKYITIYYE